MHFKYISVVYSWSKVLCNLNIHTGTEEDGHEMARYRYRSGASQQLISQNRQMTLAFTSKEGASNPSYPRGFLVNYTIGKKSMSVCEILRIQNKVLVTSMNVKILGS